MDVILYSLPNCPICKQLEKQLKKNNISFSINMDKSLMKNKNISSVPTTEINGKLYSCSETYKWIEINKRGN